jgi:rubrerythrin
MVMKYGNKEELVKKLTEMLEDELDGIIEYDCMYNSMMELGLIDEAEIVEDIANEEYTHAEAMWYMLKKHGVDLSQHRINEHWQKVKEIFDLE